MVSFKKIENDILNEIEKIVALEETMLPREKGENEYQSV